MQIAPAEMILIREKEGRVRVPESVGASLIVLDPVTGRQAASLSKPERRRFRPFATPIDWLIRCKGGEPYVAKRLRSRRLHPLQSMQVLEELIAVGVCLPAGAVLEFNWDTTGGGVPENI